MKKKFVLIGVIVLAIICILLFVFMYFKALDVKFKNNIKVNVNEKVYNTDFIVKIKNGKIKDKKRLIDTSKVGKKKVFVNFKNFFNKSEKRSYYISVIDTEKPLIEFNDRIITEQGKDIDLTKGVVVKDNSLETIEVKVLGEYDINKTGEYKLFYVAKDSSGNKTKEGFVLVVRDKIINQDLTGAKTFKTSKGFTGYVKNGITYIDGYLIANKTYSLPSTYNPGLLSDVLAKANVMFAAAKKEGLNIYISSGFRSYETQKNLYNNYVNRDGKAAADTYSARAGHSEHQTGLAFDVNQISSAFDNTAEAKWLSSNAYKYGFILRYPKGKDGETGYRYESWHFRYVGTDLASKLYNNGNWITMESYFGITSKY